jgi:hypothetical protein
MIGATTKFIIEFAAGAREKKGGCLVRTLRVLCVWKKKRRRGRRAWWTFVENFVAIRASLLRGRPSGSARLQTTRGCACDFKAQSDFNSMRLFSLLLCNTHFFARLVA